MPRRATADRQQILRSYEETGSGRETARRLGIHENTVYQLLRASRGTCRRCANEINHGQSHCDECKRKNRERAKEKAKERKRLGICARCDSTVDPPSLTLCSEHRLKAGENNRRYNTTRPLSRSNSRQRRRNLLSTFGKAGIEVWEESQGLCSMCGGKSKGKQSNHVHHIDKDPTNNVVSNLVVLCRDCHRLVHLLTEHAEPATAIAWIHRVYPGVLSG